MSVLAFTVFLRTEMKTGQREDATKFFGALFFSLLNVMFNGMAELAMTVMRFPVFYKQRDFLFYPAWIILTYYTVGFAPAASRFFKQFLALFGIHQMALSLFRFIAAVGRTDVIANTLGTCTLLVVFLLGGYIISKDDIKSWMMWGYYASPMMYGQNAIAINEFLSERWNKETGDPTEPTVGISVLKERGLFTTERWYWLSTGALLLFSLLFNVILFSLLFDVEPRPCLAKSRYRRAAESEPL